MSSLSRAMLIKKISTLLPTCSVETRQSMIDAFADHESASTAMIPDRDAVIVDMNQVPDTILLQWFEMVNK
jgi:hypothetical protein